MILAEDNFPTQTREQALRRDNMQSPIAPPNPSVDGRSEHGLTNSQGLVMKSESDTHVQISLPHNGNLAAGVMNSVLGASQRGLPLRIISPSRSYHVWNFNVCWCEALNAKPRPEYFIMHHADVMGENGWADKLLDLIRDTDADVVSCNIPIKDKSEELSTAVAKIGPQGVAIQRMKLAEATKLPETFGMKAVEMMFPHYAGGQLLVNTGLWICKFRNAKKVEAQDKQGRKTMVPWVEAFCFKMVDEIVSHEGKYQTVGNSEDWIASVEWNTIGLDIRATSAVKVTHFGNGNWEFGGKVS